MRHHRVGTRLPQIRDIEVTLSDTDQHGTRTLGLKLRDSSLQDIFHTLCVDIVSAAARAASEPDAVNTALRRTWRWHHLLRGGRSGLLSPEEQKGLIGELLVLERFLLPLLPASVAVAAWLGPLGSPKDFEVGCWRSRPRPVAAARGHTCDHFGAPARLRWCGCPLSACRGTERCPRNRRRQLFRVGPGGARSRTNRG